MLDYNAIRRNAQTAPSFVPPVNARELGAGFFNAGIRRSACLSPEMRQGWDAAEADRLAEYEMPPDFAAGLADVANGVSYGPYSVPWAEVESERWGD